MISRELEVKSKELQQKSKKLKNVVVKSRRLEVNKRQRAPVEEDIIDESHIGKLNIESNWLDFYYGQKLLV